MEIQLSKWGYIDFSADTVFVSWNIFGEKLSADNSVIAEQWEILKKEIEKQKLMKENVYNCDETGLNWKALSL